MGCDRDYLDGDDGDWPCDISQSLAYRQSGHDSADLGGAASAFLSSIETPRPVGIFSQFTIFNGSSTFLGTKILRSLSTNSAWNDVHHFRIPVGPFSGNAMAAFDGPDWSAAGFVFLAPDEIVLFSGFPDYPWKP
jgi:hypothetical protein